MRTEWIVAPVLLLVVALAVRGISGEKKKDAAVARADSLGLVIDSLGIRYREALAVRDRALQAQAEEIERLIAAVPATPPSPAPERLRVVLDTVEVPVEVREAGEELLEYVAALEDERDRLRTIVAGIPSMLAARDSLWMGPIRERDQLLAGKDMQIAALREALDEAPGWLPGWATTVLCAGVGATAGSLLEPQAAGVLVGAGAGVGACELAGWR